MLPSASSAGSALSAAIAAGVNPFATRRSSRVSTAPTGDTTTTNNNNSSSSRSGPPPPAGTDSCFGVHSIEGSWLQHDDLDEGGNGDGRISGSSGSSASSSDQTSDDDDHEHRGPAAPSSGETTSKAASHAHVTGDNNIGGSSSSGSTTGSGAVDDDIAEAMESRIHRSTLLVPSPSPDLRHVSILQSRASSGSSTSTIVSLAPPPSDNAGTPSSSEPSADANSSAKQGAAAPVPLSPTTSPVVPPSSSHARRGDLASNAPPPITHHALFDMLADAPSEPSSPASVASLPSCVASMSSLSRMSSPTDWDWRHPLSRSIATSSDHDRRDNDERPHDGSAELVLPKLTLPNTSLHLGLERWNTPGQGTRIALVASPELTRDVLGVLTARRACVQLPHGEVGVLAPVSSPSGESSVHSPLIQATIVTCLPADHIRQRAHDSYTALHALLHPSPIPEQQAGLDAMVAAYASTNDWIHLAVLLDEAAGSDSLFDIVPATTLEDEAMRLAAEAEYSYSEPLSPDSSLSPTSSMSIPSRTPRSPSGESLSDLHKQRSVERTPRPMLDTLTSWPTESAHAAAGSDFAHDAHASLLESRALENVDPLDPVWGAVGLLERILDDPARVHAASAAAFFNWRPSPLPDIASPMTGPTTSPASSTFEGAGPMPTVARAQGGGEWEATLSRRLAQRRELDAAAAQRGHRQRGRGRVARRRRSSHSPPNKAPCSNPLFPRRPIASSVGLVGLLDAAFAPVRRLVRSPWGQVIFACAIAVAVGCGIWAVRAQA